MSAPLQERINPHSTIKISFDGREALETPRFILGYWGIRGLGEGIRMMLSVAKANHWNAMYDSLDGTEEGSEDQQAYRNDKKMLKEEYHASLMNLPFLIDCDANNRIIVQTNAILTYIGRKVNMMGRFEEDLIKIEELLGETMDLRTRMVIFAYGPSHDKAGAEGVVKVGRFHFDKIEHFLVNEAKEMGQAFLVGTNYTPPDFHMYEMMVQYEALAKFYELPALFDKETTKYPKLTEYKAAFEQLPEVKSYLEDDLRGKLPIPFNNPSAGYGSDPATGGKYQWGQAAPWRQLGVKELVLGEKENGNKEGAASSANQESSSTTTPEAKRQKTE